MSFAVDQLYTQIVWSKFGSFDPRINRDSFTKAELSIAPSIYIEFQTRPGLSDTAFPGSQNPRFLVMFLLNIQSLLDFWHIETRCVFFDHAPHAKRWSTGAYRFTHQSQPAPGQTV